LPRNIEIKARIEGLEALLQVAATLTGTQPTRITQDDTFFHVSHGRLKLRQFADGRAELIHYQRPDDSAAKASDYVLVPVPDPAALREALARACGLIGHVRKQRWLFLAGQTRIHVDRVEGLGDFMELEVVLRDGQSDADGVRIADELMQALGLANAQRIAGAYFDLAGNREAT